VFAKKFKQKIIVIFAGLMSCPHGILKEKKNSNIFTSCHDAINSRMKLNQTKTLLNLLKMLTLGNLTEDFG
jgi:hypothetical protein